MLRNGARGYLLKYADSDELSLAMDTLLRKEFYHSSIVSSHLHSMVQNNEVIDGARKSQLNEKELEFLKHVCTEMTYKEIADLMCLSPRTIDSYRDHLFEKLNVKSRIGLAMFAIRRGIVKV